MAGRRAETMLRKGPRFSNKLDESAHNRRIK